MVRRRSTVRFRKGAPGREEYSNIHPVTLGVSGALFDDEQGRDLGRCEFVGHVSGSEARFCQLSGSGGGARPKLATLSRASHLTFGARAARYGRTLAVFSAMHWPFISGDTECSLSRSRVRRRIFGLWQPGRRGRRPSADPDASDQACNRSEEAGVVVAPDEVDVPKTGPADLGRDGVAAKPARPGPVDQRGGLGQERDGVAFEAGAVFPVWDGEA
jgi:hypothetical protein